MIRPAWKALIARSRGLFQRAAVGELSARIDGLAESQRSTAAKALVNRFFVDALIAKGLERDRLIQEALARIAVLEARQGQLSPATSAVFPASLAGPLPSN